jgi:hypothetical protein
MYTYAITYSKRHPNGLKTEAVQADGYTKDGGSVDFYVVGPNGGHDNVLSVATADVARVERLKDDEEPKKEVPRRAGFFGPDDFKQP